MTYGKLLESAITKKIRPFVKASKAVFLRLVIMLVYLGMPIINK